MRYNVRKLGEMGCAEMDVLERIKWHREMRGWTEYELAVRAGLSQSIISTWYAKGQAPTLHSIEKICGAFGITFAQFFGDGDGSIQITDEQKDLLDKWAALTDCFWRYLKAYIIHRSLHFALVFSESVVPTPGGHMGPPLRGVGKFIRRIKIMYS